MRFILADAIGAADKLVKLLTDESAGKPKKLLEELKKKDQWTATRDDDKAKSYGDAEKLVGQAGEILQQVQAVAKSVEDARAAAGVGVGPPLTMEILETILQGLERNANVRRVQRYLTEEAKDVPKPSKYTCNVEWLGMDKPC